MSEVGVGGVVFQIRNGGGGSPTKIQKLISRGWGGGWGGYYLELEGIERSGKHRFSKSIQMFF